METLEIDRQKWEGYFEHISHLLGVREVEMETAALEMGDQKRATWTRLTGLCYDSRADTFEVSTPDHLHEIQHPLKILASVEGMDLKSLEIEDAGGHRHFVHLRSPLMLTLRMHDQG